MSRYDEDLYDNPFFVQLEKQNKALFEKASSNRWIICIPKFSQVKLETATQADYEDHILIPKTSSDDAFTTVSSHQASFHKGHIVLGTGFKTQKKVEVLFEETFYNSKDESYRVLCVAEFFNRDTTEEVASPSGTDFSRPPGSYEDCYRILWGHQGSGKTKEILDKLLLVFCTEYQRFSGEITPTLVDLVSSQVTKAMQLVLKDQTVKRNIKQNDLYMASLKISVEMYMMNAVHKHLFATITNLVKLTDANVNKMNRNLVDVRLHHMDVRAEYEQNLPGARQELSKLNQYTTPLGRLRCLKRVVTALTRPIKTQKNDNSLMMTTDDLLPLLIYLIVKSPIPNWTANLMYMKHFLLSKISETDEFSFYLATTEAALDYINSGNLKVIKAGVQKTDAVYNRQGSATSNTPLTSTKEKFFQYVQYGDESAVCLMLKRPKSSQDDVLAQLCHPLCTCEKCLEISARSTQNSGVVSPIVRDDMGRTALHLATMFGQAGLIDVLVKNGCLTDATDYLGCTPLHIAAQKGHQNIILLLVHFGADVSSTDNEGNTPLHYCAKNGHEDCVKAILFLDILNNRLNVNAKNDMGDTPIHLAAKWGYDGIVNFLLESDADPTVRNRKRQTALNVAQNPDIRKALQKILDDPPPMIVRHPINTPRPPAPAVHSKTKPAPSPQPDKTDKPVPPTTTVSDTSVTQSASATPLGFEVLDIRTRPPIPLIDNSSSAMMSPTTPAVASLDQVDLRQIERLFKAIASKDLPLVKFYLGWSDSPEESPTSPLAGLTPGAEQQLCHPLCMCDKCQNIQKNSNMNSLHINCQNKKGFAPLHISVIEHNMDVFDLLLKKGAFVNIQTHKHITSLHLACFHNRHQMVERLVECGGNVNTPDQHGEIPLHLASAKSSPQTVEFLIQHNSNVNTINVDGQTPLHHAVNQDNVEIVHILLQHSAAPDVVNKLNRTPLDIAKNAEIQKALRSKLEELKQSKSQVPKSVSMQGLVSLEEAQNISTNNSESSKLRRHTSHMDKENLRALREIGFSIRSFDKAHSLRRSQTFDHSCPRVASRDLKLALSIKHFDKTHSLKKTKSQTIDHSTPVLDSPDLKLSLSIKNFDKHHMLRRTQTLDKSQAILEPLKLPLSIQHFETGTLKHVEPCDKSSPLHIYSLTRSFSCYSNYSDTPVTGEEKTIDANIEEVIDEELKEEILSKSKAAEGNTIDTNLEEILDEVKAGNLSETLQTESGCSADQLESSCSEVAINEEDQAKMLKSTNDNVIESTEEIVNPIVVDMSVKTQGNCEDETVFETRGNNRGENKEINLDQSEDSNLGETVDNEIKVNKVDRENVEVSMSSLSVHDVETKSTKNEDKNQSILDEERNKQTHSDQVPEHICDDDITNDTSVELEDELDTGKGPSEISAIEDVGNETSENVVKTMKESVVNETCGIIEEVSNENNNASCSENVDGTQSRVLERQSQVKDAESPEPILGLRFVSFDKTDSVDLVDQGEEIQDKVGNNIIDSPDNSNEESGSEYEIKKFKAFEVSRDELVKDRLAGESVDEEVSDDIRGTINLVDEAINNCTEMLTDEEFFDKEESD